MTLSIKNGGYAFLIRSDLMFSMSLWKELQLLQVLNDLSIKHLIKLILYEVLIIDTWNESHTSKKSQIDWYGTSLKC